VSGASVAKGLTMLGGPGNGDPLSVQSTNVLAAFSQLTSVKSVDAIGTFAPLAFDEKGAPAGGRVEIWCISKGPASQYASSGRIYDIETERLDGSYEQCK
jgi:hypothetical protein